MDERTQQVKRMADIYTYNFRVVVWIRPESEDSKLALETMEKIGRNVVIDGADYIMVTAPGATIP